MKVDVIESSDAHKVIHDDFGDHVLDDILDELAEAEEKLLIDFIPKDSGKAATSFYIVKLPHAREVGNYQDYVKFIIEGHRVLTTEKSRRWWFAYLKSIGGSYQRKTEGPKGYVPPNRFHDRASDTLWYSGIADRIIDKHLRKFD